MTKPAQLCKFCPEVGEVLCSALHRVQMIVSPSEIQVNDLYCSAADSKEWLVTAIHRATFVSSRVTAMTFTVEQDTTVSEPIWILQCQHDDKEKSWQVHSWQALADLALPVAVQRLTLCGQSACYRHYREIANGVYRCQDHWMIGSEEPISRTPDSPHHLRRPKKEPTEKQSKKLATK